MYFTNQFSANSAITMLAYIWLAKKGLTISKMAETHKILFLECNSANGQICKTVNLDDKNPYKSILQRRYQEKIGSKR